MLSISERLAQEFGQNASAKSDMTSVIMVSYRTGPVLFEAITGVLNQSAPVELVLVDNGNPPEIMTKLWDWAAREPRLRLISGQGNIGFGRGCNLGARTAKGDYLLFLNPDSVASCNVVAQLRQRAERVPRPAMLGVRLLEADGREQRGCRREFLTPETALVELFQLHRFIPGLKRLNLHTMPLPSEMTGIPAISGACMFLHHEDYWKINGFDEDYFLHVEDLDLCLRFGRMGGKIWFVPDIEILHHGHTSDAPSAFVERHKTQSFILYFHKNFSATSPAFLLALIDAGAWARFYARQAKTMLQRLWARRN